MINHQLPTKALPASTRLSVSKKTPFFQDELFNLSSDIILVTDANFCIRLMNPAATLFFCVNNQDFIGSHLTASTTLNFIAFSLMEINRELLSKSFWQGVARAINGEGRQFVFKCHCKLIRDETEKISAIIFVNTIITQTTNLPNEKMDDYFSFLQHGGIAVTEKIKSTDAKNQLEIERNTYAANASADAIWDLDIATQTIYRSESFTIFSGYDAKMIEPTLEWFLSKVHSLDKERLKTNIDYCIKNNVARWQNEYRFQIADGSYRNILDRAFAIYEAGKLTRVIGGMQDITNRKIAVDMQLEEHVQKQKIINQATIKAQEDERNRISGELHDNVNQLLMSAKLHINVVQKSLTEKDETLDKANEYILMAVEEIRNLSKQLNGSIITTIGLEKCIKEVTRNMMLSEEIHAYSFTGKGVVKKLSNDLQLILYRIIQEHSNNILKHSKATEAMITLREGNNMVELIIADNGQGFDKSKKMGKGIGLISIINRVDAYNGSTQIITEPGNGCTLHVFIPLRSAE